MGRLGIAVFKLNLMDAFKKHTQAQIPRFGGVTLGASYTRSSASLNSRGLAALSLPLTALAPQISGTLQCCFKASLPL